jgi:hypothetical protein
MYRVCWNDRRLGVGSSMALGQPVFPYALLGCTEGIRESWIEAPISLFGCVRYWVLESWANSEGTLPRAKPTRHSIQRWRGPYSLRIGLQLLSTENLSKRTREARSRHSLLQATGQRRQVSSAAHPLPVRFSLWPPLPFLPIPLAAPSPRAPNSNSRWMSVGGGRAAAEVVERREVVDRWPSLSSMCDNG